MKYHVPVLLQEVIEGLVVGPGKKYIDGTVGGGGHTLAIAKAGGEVLGIDQDHDAIGYARRRMYTELPAGMVNSVVIVRGNFKDITHIAHTQGFDEVDGVLLDIGMSSHHIDASQRGFSFRKHEPLDMRMNEMSQQTAEDIINSYSAGELEALLLRYGEEPQAARIAQRIVHAAQADRITTTNGLVKAITGGGLSDANVKMVTRVFQAIRMAVNAEDEVLRQGLQDAVALLAPGGRLVVISFHSLEDRIVKLCMRQHKEVRVIGDVITASERELSENPRSRSAKLRIAEKI